MCLGFQLGWYAWGAPSDSNGLLDPPISGRADSVWQPIGGFQLTQKKLRRNAYWDTKAQLLAWKVGKWWMKRNCPNCNTSPWQRNNVEMAINIASRSKTNPKNGGGGGGKKMGITGRNIRWCVTDEIWNLCWLRRHNTIFIFDLGQEILVCKRLI